METEHNSNNEDENYFKILGLDYSIAGSLNDRKIELAVQKWEAKLLELKNSSPRKEEKEKYDQELSKKQAMLDCMKNKKSRNQEAAAMRKIKEDKLREILKIKYRSRNKSEVLKVSEIEIRDFEKAYGLSQDDIKKIYKEFVDDASKLQIISLQGSKINVKDYLIDDHIMNSLKANIAKLQAVKSEKYSWASKVRDLYDLACFRDGGTDRDISAYRSKPASELLLIMQREGKKIAADMSPEAHAVRDILSAGQTYFFNSEASREKYDRTLALEGLCDLFASIKSATENLKKDKNFAENCIEQIAAVVKNDDLALAIYNSKAGLQRNPYLRQSYSVNLYCTNCGSRNTFSDESEAEMAKCSACHVSLYLSCPKCGKNIFAGSKICPHCGFPLEDSRKYNDLITQAKAHIKGKNLKQAAAFLGEAKNIYPDKSETKLCEEMFCGECFSAAEQAVRLGDIQTAQNYLIEIGRFMPGSSKASQLKSSIFKEYSRLFNLSLNKMELKKAEGYLDEARKFPEYSAEISSLSRKLQEKKDLYDKPVEEINKSIAAGCYEKAGRLIADAYIKYPGIKLESQKRITEEKLEKAKRQMPSASMPAKEAANRCVDILREVKDFSPALHFLRNKPPSPVNNLRCAASGSGASLCCSLSWMPSGDYGVVYRIVRKENGIPQHPSDGTVIGDEIAFLEKQDKTMHNGINYGYAVFSCRAGIYSKAAVCQTSFYGDITDFKAAASSGSCSFQWNFPENCAGVRIFRCENRLPGPNDSRYLIKGMETANFFADKIKNGIRYGYLFQAVYGKPGSWHYSSGISQFVSPETPPPGLNNPYMSVGKDLKVSVRWQQSEARQNAVIQQIFKPVPQGIKGRIIQESDIPYLFGRLCFLAKTDSSLGQISFEIRKNSKIDFALLAARGSRYYVCEIFSASSVEKCEINKERTLLSGSALRIRLKECPENLVRIYYHISESPLDMRTLKNKFDHVHSITAEAYRKNGVITLSGLHAVMPLNIYVKGTYIIDGRELDSEPDEFTVCP